VNKVQHKGIEDYAKLMTDSFKEMKRVLKVGSWVTIVFHNSSEQIWNAIRLALFESGFQISKAQIFDKQHGTFKMFVSENAVGYDLILHCQKNSSIKSKKNIETSVVDFVKDRIKNGNYISNFIHVDRSSETNFRKLYSEWIASEITSNEIKISFDTFRNLASKLIEYA